MPIYEYICRKCGDDFEELVFSQEALPPCPQCGSTEVEKLMSACAARTDGDAGPDFGSTPPMGGGGCAPGG